MSERLLRYCETIKSLDGAVPSFGRLTPQQGLIHDLGREGDPEFCYDRQGFAWTGSGFRFWSGSCRSIVESLGNHPAAKWLSDAVPEPPLPFASFLNTLEALPHSIE